MKCSKFVKQSVNDGTRNIDMRIAYFRRIVKLGNSYAIAIPKDVRILLEANEGDWIRIEVEKIEVVKDDTNLHDDNAARQDPEARDKGIHQDERHTQVDNSEGNRVNGVRTLAGEDIHFGIF